MEHQLGITLASAKSNAIKQEFFPAFMGEFFASARKRFPNFVTKLNKILEEYLLV